MNNKTTEFSFVLKPSEYGVGIFAVHDIKTGTYLRLFREKDEPRTAIVRKKEDVPEFFQQWCVDRGNTLMCPRDFGHMEIGWYLNHSKTPNAHRDDNYNYYASRDISKGKEVTIDYNSLEEPEEARDEYY